MQISTGFASWQRYCMAVSIGRQPNFVALNRGRHLYLAGRPSRWALAHILVLLDLLPRIFRLLFPPPSIQRGISSHSVSDDLGRSSRSFVYCVTAGRVSRWMLPDLSQSVELNCSSTSAAVFMHCSVLCAQSNPTSSVMTTEVQPSLKLHYAAAPAACFLYPSHKCLHCYGTSTETVHVTLLRRTLASSP